MATFEQELARFGRMIGALSRFSVLWKKTVIYGDENFVRVGPNIIVGNHCGSFKDVATLFRVVPRPFFFTANKMIFSRRELDFLVRKHLKRHLKDSGIMINFLLAPFKSLFVTYVSSNIAKIGTIPVDLYNIGKRDAIERCQEYLEAGRAIVALQGRGRVMPQDPNPYVRTFGRGTSIIAYNVFEREGLRVPVTPMAIFGTHLPLFIPGKIRVNVGRPMYVSDFLAGDRDATVRRFKLAVEAEVNRLFVEILSLRREPA